MLPLLFAKQGERHTIKQIGGSQEQKKHLENLGFVVGGEIIVVNESAGNLIVNVKESRVGVSLELAKKIMI